MGVVEGLPVRCSDMSYCPLIGWGLGLGQLPDFYHFRCYRGSASSRRSATTLENITSTLYFIYLEVQRYPPYPDSCLSKVNVWAMSSLLGVW